MTPETPGLSPIQEPSRGNTLRVCSAFILLGLLILGAACKSATATPVPLPTVTPTIAPIATAGPETAQPPTPSATSSQSAHLSFVLSLTGAVPVESDYEEDMGGDFNCNKGPFYEIFGAPIPDSNGDEVNFALAPSATLALKAGDSVSLTNGGDLIVSIGDQDFTLTSNSSASMQVSQNGSGRLAFQGLVATTDTTQEESGEVSWTCKQ